MAANTCRSWRALGLMAALLCGCSQPSTTADAGVPDAIQVEAGGPLTSLEAPPEVVAFGGSDAPGRFLGEVAGLFGGRDTAHDALAEIADRYAIPAEAVDLDKPMRVAVFDPKGQGQPSVLIVGVKSRADLVAALPTNRRAGEGGNAFAYTAPADRSVYLSFIGESAVALSERAELVPRHRDFLAKLAGAQPGAGAALVVQIEAGTKVYAVELERLRARREARWAARALDELARAELTVDADAHGLGAQLTVRPRTKSALATTLAGLAKRGARRPALLAKLPSTSAMVMGASVEPASPLGHLLSAWLLQTPADGEASPAHSQALAEFSQATTGEVAFALHAYPDKGPVLSAFVGLRDATKALDAERRARQVYTDPKVIEAFDKLGVKLLFQPGGYRVGLTPVDVVTARESEPAAGSGALTVHRALGAGADAFFALMSSHMLLDGELGRATFGEYAQIAMMMWRADPSDGVAYDKKRLAPGAFAIVEAWPSRLIALAGDAKDAGGAAVLLSAGAADGALQVRLEIPKSEAKRLDKALTALRELP